MSLSERNETGRVWARHYRAALEVRLGVDFTLDDLLAYGEKAPQVETECQAEANRQTQEDLQSRFGGDGAARRWAEFRSAQGDARAARSGRRQHPAAVRRRLDRAFGVL